MSFEQLCVEITGLKENPLAAKKIFLLLLFSWVLSIACVYIAVTATDSLGKQFVELLNEDIRLLPMGIEDFEGYIPMQVDENVR